MSTFRHDDVLDTHISVSPFMLFVMIFEAVSTTTSGVISRLLSVSHRLPSGGQTWADGS